MAGAPDHLNWKRPCWPAWGRCQRPGALLGGRTGGRGRGNVAASPVGFELRKERRMRGPESNVRCLVRLCS